MAVVAKKDIQTLTKQLIQEKDNILESIKQQFVEIDPSFLSASFAVEVETKLKQMHTPQKDSSNERVLFSLEAFEQIVDRFDTIDRKLSESKVPKTNTTVRKENCSMKRYGSMADVNKTLVRSQSTQSLNTTKTFNGPPQMQAPKMVSDHNLTSASNSDNIDMDNAPKLTTNELSKHNLIGEEIEMRLNSNQSTDESYQSYLNDVHQAYKASFERLKNFCEEVQKIQTSKSTELYNDSSLMSLDQNLLDLMEKQSKALYQIRFIAENQNIYTTGIKGIDSLLSDDLTDILEHFYRITK